MKSIMKGVLSIIVLCIFNWALFAQTNGGVVDVEYRICTGCSSTEDLDKGDADSLCGKDKIQNKTCCA